MLCRPGVSLGSAFALPYPLTHAIPRALPLAIVLVLAGRLVKFEPQVTCGEVRLHGRGIT